MKMMTRANMGRRIFMERKIQSPKKGTRMVAVREPPWNSQKKRSRKYINSRSNSQNSQMFAHTISLGSASVGRSAENLTIKRSKIKSFCSSKQSVQTKKLMQNNKIKDNQQVRWFQLRRRLQILETLFYLSMQHQNQRKSKNLRKYPKLLQENLLKIRKKKKLSL